MSEEVRQLAEEVKRLRDEVDRLRSIEEIRRVKYKYWRCFDTADLEGMAEVLHENVTLSVVAGIYSMCIEGRDSYLQMVKEGAHAEMISHHNGHHGEIDLLGNNEALGTWYLYDDLYEFRRGYRLYGTAFYRDKYVKREGRWTIFYSQFHRLYEICDDMSKAPNVTYHYLGEHGYRHPVDHELPPFEKVPGYQHPEGVLPPFLDVK